ncbi:uncharacterized protein LOC131320682 [Rhododendron vialii]|uniref:uncharacterized protein LOC131320682 n=1 Tax=Rhododendron vialii TaxID=182163 RepID=UPI00265D926C|nr:uncharacterized protein LOC131320682 [Rhododendron vialii]
MLSGRIDFWQQFNRHVKKGARVKMQPLRTLHYPPYKPRVSYLFLHFVLSFLCVSGTCSTSSPMDENNTVQIPFTQSPPNPSPSLPLQLSGFLNGDTVQVQGDTEAFQFAVQFNIHHKHHHRNSETHVQFPNATEEDRTSLNTASLSYLTPVTTHRNEEENETHGEPSREGSSGEENAFVLTRLRSGVLSRVKYFPPPGTTTGSGHRSLCSWKKQRVRIEKGKGIAKETGDVLERVLRRRRFPVRPCSSYTFFVTTTWGVANSESFSFGETSKRLSKMWCSLPHDEKKVYEDMALKDNARYKLQRNLWKNQVHNKVN